MEKLQEKEDSCANTSHLTATYFRLRCQKNSAPLVNNVNKFVHNSNDKSLTILLVSRPELKGYENLNTNFTKQLQFDYNQA